MTRAVVLLPGATFGPFAPLLFLPMYAALRRGAGIVPIPGRYARHDAAAATAEVAAQVEPVLSGRDPAETLLSASRSAPGRRCRGRAWLPLRLADPVAGR